MTVKIICQPAKCGVIHSSVMSNGNRLEIELVFILKTCNTEEWKEKLWYVNVSVILICSFCTCNLFSFYFTLEEI